MLKSIILALGLAFVASSASAEIIRTPECQAKLARASPPGMISRRTSLTVPALAETTGLKLLNSPALRSGS